MKKIQEGPQTDADRDRKTGTVRDTHRQTSIQTAPARKTQTQKTVINGQSDAGTETDRQTSRKGQT